MLPAVEECQHQIQRAFACTHRTHPFFFLGGGGGCTHHNTSLLSFFWTKTDLIWFPSAGLQYTTRAISALFYLQTFSLTAFFNSTPHSFMVGTCTVMPSKVEYLLNDILAFKLGTNHHPTEHQSRLGRRSAQAVPRLIQIAAIPLK